MTSKRPTQSKRKTARKTAPKAALKNSLWGGRFSSGPADIMARINASISIDKRMYAQDIAASRAHCDMLVAQKIITKADGKKINSGLDTILAQIVSGKFVFSEALEDIHLNIEARLSELIGPAAGRLHTARSRNDQVATDFRLWTREAIDALNTRLKELIGALLSRAETHADALMPGFTHLQIAQPVTFGHHLMAYVEMFGRDVARFKDARARLNESPLGACALAGTPFPIDRNATAKALGFAGPMRNSLDAVSDRDFALEFLAASAICATHLSRLAEEIVLWSTSQFGFVSLPDSFSTGSSIMPQKRNPDAAELVRGKSGRVIGALSGLLIVMKGLPLAYSKDMQEDKEKVFDAADTMNLCIAAMTGMIGSLIIHRQTMAAAAGDGYSTATDLADWLVRALNMPFREAHHVVGKIVKLCEAKHVSLTRLPLKDMQAVEPRITAAARAVLAPDASVASRTSFGGTAPANVRKAIARARKELG